jgi:D-3-phosphoglycerate dehydrogenase / 2-oxoglutarate reductase
MDRILFITPIKHLPVFYNYVYKNYEFVELTNSTYNDVKDIIKQYDILFCAPNHQTFIIDEDLVKDTNIKCICSPSTGLNHINVDSVPIISIKNDKVIESIWSTAEHTLYLILSIVRHIKPVRELHDKTLGIIGYGRLGQMLEEMCKNVFKEIIVVDKSKEYYDELFEKCDVLSLHVDLNSTSYQMINEKFLNNFKKNIYIVNTSRGEIVNEEDINSSLLSGRLLGYATDVLQTEYNSKESIFKNNDKVIVTPHIAGVTLEAQERTYIRTLKKYENNS